MTVTICACGIPTELRSAPRPAFALSRWL